MNFTLGNMNVHIFDAMLTFNAHEDEKQYRVFKHELSNFKPLIRHQKYTFKS